LLQHNPYCSTSTILLRSRIYRRYVYVAEVENAKGTAEPVHIIADRAAADEAALVEEVQIYLIAVDDNVALNLLLSLTVEPEGTDSLYNALAASDLKLDEAGISNSEAYDSLTGQLNLGGTCEGPRVLAQLEHTAR
jgi:hypothetical protein